MTIDFTLSDDQQKLQYNVRAFAENVLAPVVPEADKEPDPLLAYAMTKPAYIEAYKAGIAMCMLPNEYAAAEFPASTWSLQPRKSASSTQDSPVPYYAMAWA